MMEGCQKRINYGYRLEKSHQTLTDLGTASGLGDAGVESDDGSVEGSLGKRAVRVFVSSEDSVEDGRRRYPSWRRRAAHRVPG